VGALTHAPPPRHISHSRKRRSGSDPSDGPHGRDAVRDRTDWAVGGGAASGRRAGP